ncbi:serine O-acetyl transferase [Chloropicon primus]|nr:serine O-acetyl transferase [Chloropicon primus]
MPARQEEVLATVASRVWTTIREEVQRDYQSEPLLSGFMFSTILAHDTMEESLAFILAKKLENAVLPAPKLSQLFQEVLRLEEVRKDYLADLMATYERDPACRRYSSCFLYYKGFHAIQTHRVAHALYNQGRTSLALFLQSRSSEAFHVDIHPGARIGRGMMLDHATGVVMGETAVVGDNCSMLHSVTLGGSGKVTGDRHPKIGKGVFIGAGAVILGNVKVGDDSKIGSCAVVTKEVPAKHVAVGMPAKMFPLRRLEKRIKSKL